MVVLTVQRKAVARKIFQGSYKSDFLKSDIVYLGGRYLSEYSKFNRSLNMICNRPRDDRELYWGWVYNPFMDFFYNPEEYMGIFLEVPDERVILSDYDIYTGFCNEDSDFSDYIVTSDKDMPRGSCIQCTFKDFSPENILKVVPFTALKGMRGTAEDILHNVGLMENLLCVNSLANVYPSLQHY